MYEENAGGGNRRDGGVGVVSGLEMLGFESVCEVLIVATFVFLCCLKFHSNISSSE